MNELSIRERFPDARAAGPSQSGGDGEETGGLATSLVPDDLDSSDTLWAYSSQATADREIGAGRRSRCVRAIIGASAVLLVLLAALLSTHLLGVRSGGQETGAGAGKPLMSLFAEPSKEQKVLMRQISRFADEHRLKAKDAPGLYAQLDRVVKQHPATPKDLSLLQEVFNRQIEATHKIELEAAQKEQSLQGLAAAGGKSLTPGTAPSAPASPARTPQPRPARAPAPLPARPSPPSWTVPPPAPSEGSLG